MRQLGTYPFDDAIEKVLNHASVDWNTTKPCRGGKGVKLLCILPKHNDSVPSLMIDRTTGRFKCYGCGQSGSIYDLGKVIGIDIGTGKETDIFDPDLDEFAMMSEKLDDIEKSDSGVVTPPLHLRPLPPNLVWRGMPASFLSEAGAKLWYDPLSFIERVWFPCLQDEEMVGWFARIRDESCKQKFRDAEAEAKAEYKRYAKLKKKDKSHLQELEADYFKAKKRLDMVEHMKYRNNDKQKTYLILFPLDLVLKRFPNCKKVLLVEGQVDALWLIWHGIPALSILGTNNWSTSKETILMSHGFRKIILAMDGDEAGEKAQKKLYRYLRHRFKVAKYQCPEKRDPAELTGKEMKAVRQLLS